jgi:hypothetical protein
VQALRAAARDAMHLREEGLIRLPDPEIVAKAAQERYAVFGEGVRLIADIPLGCDHSL